MERIDIINKLRKYFKIQELVCKHVYTSFGEKSWQFFDTNLLRTLLTLREDIFQRPMTINNWHDGKNYSQRGLRCNVCQIPSDKTKDDKIYMSAHCNGAGIDFDVKDMLAKESRDLIKKNSIKLPNRIRLEKDVSWVHLDVYEDPLSGLLITEF